MVIFSKNFRNFGEGAIADYTFVSIIITLENFLIDVYGAWIDYSLFFNPSLKHYWSFLLLQISFISLIFAWSSKR